MKTLKQMLELYTPKAGDEKKFADKHKVEKHKNLGGKATEDDQLFQATNVKTIDREKEHGYNPDGSDEKVYEEVVAESSDEGFGADLADTYHDLKGHPKAGPHIKKAMKAYEDGDMEAAAEHRDMAVKAASVKEGIEDRLEAARNKAKAAGKTMKEPEQKKSLKRFVAGKAYGGSKQKDDKEEMNESKTSDALYKQHHARVKDLLKKIGSAADTHKANVQGNSHYGHVGDMSSFANQLQDLHDRMAMQGEYAAPIAVKEDVEQVEEKASPEKVAKTMREFKKGKLHSGSKTGPVVTSRKQAIAIALNREETDLQPRTLKQILEAMVTLHVKPHPEKKGQHVVVKSSDSSRFKKGESVAATELEQGQDDGYLKVKHVKE